MKLWKPLWRSLENLFLKKILTRKRRWGFLWNFSSFMFFVDGASLKCIESFTLVWNGELYNIIRGRKCSFVSPISLFNTPRTLSLSFFFSDKKTL